jgi:hypothetical protein
LTASERAVAQVEGWILGVHRVEPKAHSSRDPAPDTTLEMCRTNLRAAV